MTTETGAEQAEERAEALLAVVRLASRVDAPPEVIVGAMVECLGITPEMVEAVRNAKRGDHIGDAREHEWRRDAADALSVLLRAAGREVER